MKRFNCANWFWKIAVTDQIYSSASGDFVDASDESYREFIADGTEAPTVSADDMAKIRILMLEQTVTERRRREAGTDDAGGSAEGRAWMSNIEAQIAALRGQLAT